MKQTTSVSKITRIASWLAAAIIISLPFHAFITVWLSSVLGHYTLLRLWKEFLLIPIVLGAIYLLIRKKQIRTSYFRSNTVRLILLYLLVLIIWATASLLSHNATTKATWYGLMVDSRFLIFFLAVLVLSALADRLSANWQKFVLVPAIFVATFAILQYLVLPYDFLKHFGYGDATISPYETINHNLEHLRVSSFLRGSNPLGAYLLMPISLLLVLYLKQKRQRINIAIFGGGLLMALIFSFSRSAWLGLVLALAVILWLSIKNTQTKKLLVAVGAFVLISGTILTVTLRNNSSFQTVIYHTDNGSVAAESSNQGHSTAFKNAAQDIVHEPLGRGVGTAGPASEYNFGHYVRISEDYFMQIGQETGWIGMILFITICLAVGRLLFERRTDPLALALFASFAGITFVNLLSHAWADDTLAYVWWGLAGIALSPVIMEAKHNRQNGHKIKTTP